MVKIVERSSRGNLGTNNSYSKKLIHGTVHATVGIDSPKRIIELYGRNSNRIELLRILERESKFKLWWYAIFLTFSLVFLCIYPKSYLSILELLILMVGIDLTSRGKIIGVVISIFECVLYAYISWSSGLIGEVIKNLAIAVPLNIYTIISWSINSKKLKQSQRQSKYKKQDSADIVIKKMSPKMLAISCVLTALVVVASYFLLKYGLKQKVSLITSALVFAFMCTYKTLSGARYMESWIFAIIQSCLSLLMWCVTILSGSATITELPMIAVTLACLSNHIYGYTMWKALYRRVAVNGGEILAKRRMSIKKVIKIRRRFKTLYWNKKIDQSKNS